MNLKKREKIGIREYTALVILTMTPKLADSMPMRLYEESGNAAWMSAFIAGLFAIVLFYILSKIVTSFDNKNLLDVIEILCGNFFGWIIIFLLWINLSIHIVVELGISTDLISTMYYNNTPMFIICFATIIIISYAVVKVLQSLGSVAWIILIFTQIAVIMSLILTVIHGEFSFIYPLFGNGEWTAIKVGFKNTSIYIDLLYFLIFVTEIRSKKKFLKGSWIGIIVVIAEIILAILAYLILFYYKAITQLSFPYHEVIRYISLGFITNVETLFFPFFIVITFLRFSVFLYMNVILFGRLFKIEKPRYLAPTIATIFGFVSLIPNNPIFVLPVVKNVQVMWLTGIWIAITILLGIRFKIKGVKVDE